MNTVGPPSSTGGIDLKAMSVDELWKLHEEVTAELAQKLQSEKNGLEQRLRQLRGGRQRIGPLSGAPPFAPMRPPEVENRKAKAPPGEAGPSVGGACEV